MQKIIKETEELAFAYLKAFGFEEDEILPVVMKGRHDLETTLEKLQEALGRDNVSDQELDDILHSLKGLLFHMGNNDLAQQVDEIRHDTDREALEQKLKVLFFNG